jgi:hypothetical protein
VEKDAFICQKLANILDTSIWPSKVISLKRGQFFLTDEMKFQLVGSKWFNHANYLFVYEAETSNLFIVCQYVTSSTFVFHVQSRTYTTLHSGFNHFDERRLEPLNDLASYLQIHLEDLRNLKLEMRLELGEFSIHHYFYDSLPGFVANSLLIEDKNSSVLALEKSNEFLDTQELLGFLERSEDLSGIERSTSTSTPILYLRTGYPYSRLTRDLQMKLDEKILIHVNNRNPVSIVGNPKIWIDLSMLNRKWNLEETLPKLLIAIMRDFSSAHIIFDDLTSTFDRDSETPSGRSLPKWLEVILEETNVTNYTNLSFAQASEKIAHAQMCDFFFASYSTGSMFPSRFARLPGVALSSPRTYLFEQDRGIFQHENITVIPIEYFTFEDMIGPSPWIDFSLDVDKFVDWAMTLLKQSILKAS